MQKLCNLLVLIALCFSQFSCSAYHNENLVVQAFEQGLMREEGGVYKIYEHGEKFNYKNNGVCIYDHKNYPCMWFGFRFKTNNDIKKISLNCDVTLLEPDDMGNPEGVQGSGAQKYHVELALESNNGWFSNPQYIIKEPDIKNQKITILCSYKGHIIFKPNFEINFSE